MLITLEVTPDEAEILIAALADQANAHANDPKLQGVLDDLRVDIEEQVG